ncbi:hypothetical protein C5167_034236 [Papaver somniferum]|uniref:Uncharacterized protein n=1 Tax=Papaver somniferum TaxID=3469 RepID=A0A4Y7KGJ5_PAPSO|nr:hypothetical protein C5167_034236 [Papaver somniferum]
MTNEDSGASKTAGAVYSPFIDLEANKAANKVVSIGFEGVEIRKQVWSLGLHLMDHNE